MSTKPDRYVPALESRWVLKGVRENPLTLERGQLAAEFRLCTFKLGVEQVPDLSDVSQPRQFFTPRKIGEMCALPPHSLALQFGLTSSHLKDAFAALLDDLVKNPPRLPEKKTVAESKNLSAPLPLAA